MLNHPNLETTLSLEVCSMKKRKHVSKKKIVDEEGVSHDFFFRFFGKRDLEELSASKYNRFSLLNQSGKHISNDLRKLAEKQSKLIEKEITGEISEADRKNVLDLANSLSQKMNTLQDTLSELFSVLKTTEQQLVSPPEETFARWMIAVKSRYDAEKKSKDDKSSSSSSSSSSSNSGSSISKSDFNKLREAIKNADFKNHLNFGNDKYLRKIDSFKSSVGNPKKMKVVFKLGDESKEITFDDFKTSGNINDLRLLVYQDDLKKLDNVFWHELVNKGFAIGINTSDGKFKVPFKTSYFQKITDLIGEDSKKTNKAKVKLKVKDISKSDNTLTIKLEKKSHD